MTRKEADGAHQPLSVRRSWKMSKETRDPMLLSQLVRWGLPPPDTSKSSYPMLSSQRLRNGWTSLTGLMGKGDYFISRVHNDFDAIMGDMREAHRGRSDSAPKKTVIEEMKQDLEEAASFKGSRLEQWLLIYCKQGHLPYNWLTEEEKQWSIRIGSRSDFLKSHTPQRGKRRK